MIQYSLKCDRGHRFDSWFQNSAAFDKLHAAGLVACSDCGSTEVEKALMAPRVNHAPAAPQSGTPERPLAPADDDRARALREMRRQVEANSTYVGGDFAREARAIHEGEAPKRQIHGEAKPEEARALLKEGIPVLPLPFAVGRKTN